MCRRKLRQVGFTLIELLVVIAIIALLVSILVPTLTLAKELARRALCSSQFHQIAIADNMYAAEFEQNLPYAATWWNMLQTNSKYWPGLAPGQVRPCNAGVLFWEGFLMLPEILDCPSASIQRGVSYMKRPVGGDPPVSYGDFLMAKTDTLNGFTAPGQNCGTNYTTNVFHNPWGCWRSGNAAALKIEGSGWRSSYPAGPGQLEITRTLITDWVGHRGPAGELQGFPHGLAGLNIGSLDGSVRFKIDGDLYDVVASYPSAGELTDSGYMDTD